MRSHWIALVLVTALAAPAAVVLSGDSCALVLRVEAACCGEQQTEDSASVTRTSRVDAACCCEIHEQTPTSQAAEDVVLPVDTEPGDACAKAPGRDAGHVVSRAGDHLLPDARGPPLLQTLFSQRISLLI